METRSESSKSSSAELLVTLAISLLLTQHQAAAVARMNQCTLPRPQLRLMLEYGGCSHLTQRRTTQYLTPPLQWGRGSLQLSRPGATTGARQTLPPACSSSRHQPQYSQH